jgi:hypothetical protein
MSKQQKSKGFTTRELFEEYDGIIDDMLADPWSEVTPQEAVGLSEIVAIVNVERQAAGRPELVALPPWVHLQVNACAKRGMLKGGGRKGQPRSPLIKWFLEMVLIDAKEAKYELLRSGAAQSLPKAENQALEDAVKTLREHGFEKPGVETIRRKFSDV